MAPCLSLKFTGHGTKFLWVSLPPLGLMSRLYDRGTQWEQIPQLPLSLMTALGGTNIPTQRQKQRKSEIKWKVPPHQSEYRQDESQSGCPALSKFNYHSQSSMHIFLLVLLKQRAEQFLIQAERALTVQLVISGKECAVFIYKKTKVGGLFSIDWRQ